MPTRAVVARARKIRLLVMDVDGVLTDGRMLLSERGAVSSARAHLRSVIDARWHIRPVRDEFRIRGTDGEIDLTPLNGAELVYPGGVESHPAHQNLHYPCVEDFVSAVLEKRAPRSSGNTALPAEWVMEQAYATGA